MNLVFGLVVLCLMSINSLVCFMGRYVAIGLMTGLYFKNREAKKIFDSSLVPLEMLQKFHAPEDIYDVMENEEGTFLSLKDELLQEGLVDFLRDFYDSRYAFSDRDSRKYIDEALEKVGACKTAQEVFALASKKELYKFQTDSYWDPIYLLNKWDEVLRVTVFGIDLSIDGKILMECSDHLWDYVTTLMRKSLKQHKLAGALHMTITG